MTAIAERIPETFDFGGTWEEKSGSWWLVPEAAGPRDVARAMLARGARFITITATELPDQGGIRMDYHWDLDGTVLTFTFTIRDKTAESVYTAESIYDLSEAANLIEREIHEYFAVEFAGRECEPLFLHAGQTPGVNLREEDE